MNVTTAKRILTKVNPANLYSVFRPAREVSEIRDLRVEGNSPKARKTTNAMPRKHV